MLKEANKLTENFGIIIIVLILAFVLGLIKNKYIMSKFCLNNLKRISEINSPKVHQFFSPGFFFALTLMILAGISFSKFAFGNYSFMLAIGGLDLALSTALLTSSVIFYREKL